MIILAIAKNNYYAEKKRLSIALPGIIEQSLIDGKGQFNLKKMLYELQKRFECGVKKPLMDLIDISSDSLSYDETTGMVFFKGKKVKLK